MLSYERYRCFVWTELVGYKRTYIIVFSYNADGEKDSFYACIYIETTKREKLLEFGSLLGKDSSVFIRCLVRRELCEASHDFILYFSTSSNHVSENDIWGTDPLFVTIRAQV